MSAEAQQPRSALSVLRDVWTAQGQDTAALAEECGTTQSCKRMTAVGFDDLAGPDGDLQAAWKAKLASEGKLTEGASGVRDLVFTPVEAH